MSDPTYPLAFPRSVRRQIARWPIAKRLVLRRRLNALIDAMVERLVQRGEAVAQAICIQKVALYARIAPGIRLTIWRQVRERVREYEANV